MTTYKSKGPIEVQAVRYVYPASDEVQDFLGSLYKSEWPSDHVVGLLSIYAHPDNLYVDSGMWIVKDADHMFALTDREFRKRYEVGNEVKALQYTYPANEGFLNFMIGNNGVAYNELKARHPTSRGQIKIEFPTQSSLLLLHGDWLAVDSGKCFVITESQMKLYPLV